MVDLLLLLLAAGDVGFVGSCCAACRDWLARATFCAWRVARSGWQGTHGTEKNRSIARNVSLRVDRLSTPQHGTHLGWHHFTHCIPCSGFAELKGRDDPLLPEHYSNGSFLFSAPPRRSLLPV